MEKKIIEIRNLHTSFYTHAGEVQAVRGIDMFVEKGETLGIVGESGCGKSVTMLSVMRLLPDAGKVKSGDIFFNKKKISHIKEKEMQKIRGNEMSMIFQDPMTSLNPVYKVGNQLTEHLIKHKRISKTKAKEAAIEMLELVGIPNPKERYNQYPHEFSGGMRQRVMIAIALVTKPKLIIADEPTTALDVTIQAQILELLKGIKKELDTAIILITHDLGVVADTCDRIHVMYGGIIVEKGTTEEIFYNPKHPYTWGLLNSVPKPNNNEKSRLSPIQGQPPDLIKPPKGCPFFDRCQARMVICKDRLPENHFISSTQSVSCWLAHPMADKKTMIDVYPHYKIESYKQKIAEGR